MHRTVLVQNVFEWSRAVGSPRRAAGPGPAAAPKNRKPTLLRERPPADSPRTRWGSFASHAPTRDRTRATAGLPRVKPRAGRLTLGPAMAIFGGSGIAVPPADRRAGITVRTLIFLNTSSHRVRRRAVSDVRDSELHAAPPLRQVQPGVRSDLGRCPSDVNSSETFPFGPFAQPKDVAPSGREAEVRVDLARRG
jgi:hypothetical protein